MSQLCAACHKSSQNWLEGARGGQRNENGARARDGHDSCSRTVMKRSAAVEAQPMTARESGDEHFAKGRESKQRTRTIGEVMNKDVQSVESSETVRAVAKRLSDLDVGALPVCRGGELVGMITDRDLVLRVIAENQCTTSVVSDAMSEDVISAYEDDEIATVLMLMRENQVTRIPVITRTRQLVGLVAWADIGRGLVSLGTKASSGEELS